MKSTEEVKANERSEPPRGKRVAAVAGRVAVGGGALFGFLLLTALWSGTASADPVRPAEPAPRQHVTGLVDALVPALGDEVAAVAPLDRAVAPLRRVTEPVERLVQPVTAPVVALAAPAVESVGRVADPVVRPVVQAVRPVTSAVAQVAAPVTRVVEPLVGAVEPVTRVVSPLVGAVEPVVRAIDPVVRTVEPVVRAVDPVVRTVEPVVRAIDPVARSLAPVAESVPPAQSQPVAQAPSTPVPSPVKTVGSTEWTSPVTPWSTASPAPQSSADEVVGLPVGVPGSPVEPVTPQAVPVGTSNANTTSGHHGPGSAVLADDLGPAAPGEHRRGPPSGAPAQAWCDYYGLKHPS